VKIRKALSTKVRSWSISVD